MLYKKYYAQTKRARQEGIETTMKWKGATKMKLTKLTSSHDEFNFEEEST